MGIGSSGVSGQSGGRRRPSSWTSLTPTAKEVVAGFGRIAFDDSARERKKPEQDAAFERDAAPLLQRTGGEGSGKAGSPKGGAKGCWKE